MGSGIPLGLASVEIVADLSPLSPALDRARQIVATSMSEMQQTVSDASRAISSVLELYGISKLAEWGSELLNLGANAVATGANLQESASAVGLTAEQYQIFSFAARQAGVDQGKFSQAMIFFSRNLGLISQGITTPATKAFADLGVTLKTNSDGTVNYSATLTEFLTKLGNVKDSTTATADAMEAFGRGGGRMVLVAKEVANEGFDAISQKARAMGLVLSNETVQQSKELEDQFKTLSTVVENDVIRGMVALAPDIQQVVDKVLSLSDAVSRFISLTPNLDGLTKEQIALYESGLAPALEEATTKLDDLQKQQQRYSQQGMAPPRDLVSDLQKQLDLVQQLGSKMSAAQAAMQRILHPDTGAGLGDRKVNADDGTDAAQEKLQEQFDKTTQSIASQTQGYLRLADAMGLGTNAMREAETANAIQGELDKFNGQLSAQQVQQIYNEVTARQEQKYALDDEKKSLDDANKSEQEQNQQIDEFLTRVEGAHTPLQRLADDIDELNVLLASGDIDWDEYTADLDNLGAEFGKADAQAQKTANTLADEVSSAVSKGASSFLDLATSTEKGKSGVQGLQTAALGLVQDLLKVVEQLFVLNPLINELKSALGSTGAPLPTGNLSGIESSLGFGGASGAPSAGSTDASGGLLGGAASAGLSGLLKDAFTNPSGILSTLFGDTNMSSILSGVSGGDPAQFLESLFPSGSGFGSWLSGLFGGSSASDASDIFSSLGAGDLFGFASGGAFDVGGAGGIDSQLVQFKATPGEHVSVGQDRGPAPSAAPNIIINNNHPSAQVSAEMHPNGRDTMITIAEAMARDTRTGGPLGRAQKETWGLNRVPIQR